MAAGDDPGLGPAAARFQNSGLSQKPPVAILYRSRSRRLVASSITKNVERAKAGQAGTIAFYAARMGTFYSEQLTRFGFGDEVRTIKQAWDSGGSKAGTEAVSPKMLSQLGYAGDVQGARERIIEHEKAGADLARGRNRREGSRRVRKDRRNAPELVTRRDKMKAAVFQGTKKPLVVQDVPDPECAPNGALIRVEANGVCRSDWHAWSGDWHWMGLVAQPGQVLGHELCGVVEEVGKDVKIFQEGRSRRRSIQPGRRHLRLLPQRPVKRMRYAANSGFLLLRRLRTDGAGSVCRFEPGRAAEER